MVSDALASPPVITEGLTFGDTLWQGVISLEADLQMRTGQEASPEERRIWSLLRKGVVDWSGPDSEGAVDPKGDRMNLEN